MARNLGCLDSVRIIFRESVRASESTLRKTASILANTFVAACFGLHMVLHQPAHPVSRQAVSVRRRQMEDIAPRSSRRVRGGSLHPAAYRCTGFDQAGLSAEQGLAKLP